MFFTVSAVSVDSTVLKVAKPKERCKYHPNCNKQFCEYYHPSAPCKSFPNCKFADKCMYSHPKCKFDLACMSIDCNFAHSGSRDLSHVQLVLPPLCKWNGLTICTSILMTIISLYWQRRMWYLCKTTNRYPHRWQRLRQRPCANTIRIAQKSAAPSIIRSPVVTARIALISSNAYSITRRCKANSSGSRHWAREEELAQLEQLPFISIYI